MEEKKQPTFSVLLPVHRDDIYLEESIESTLLGIPENCILYIVVHKNHVLYLNLIEKYKSEKIVIINDLTSQNLAEVLNNGLQQIKENYVFRMDSDDVWLPNRYEIQSKQIKLDPTISLVASGITVENTVNNQNYVVKYAKSTKLSLIDFIKGCPIAHPTVLFNKDVVTKVGGYDSQVNFTEDYDLWLRLVKKNKIVVTNDVVLKYRYHHESQSKVHLQEQNDESNHIKLNAICMYLRIPKCRRHHQINHNNKCSGRLLIIELMVALFNLLNKIKPKKNRTEIISIVQEFVRLCKQIEAK
jgi:glycosyltransferase involved in cell wall biosynthesis